MNRRVFLSIGAAPVLSPILFEGSEAALPLKPVEVTGCKVVLELDCKTLAEAIVPLIPNYVKRHGLV